ncbi:hypothetical protein ACIGXF_20325 [Streptomyces sp. NPDC053086]|uniref:hypothetical protein n=1 Tax=unclassified Streptomyces TaxID=2593676 RepID=UPI0037D570B0
MPRTRRGRHTHAPAESGCVLSLHHRTIHPTANLDTPEPGIDLDIVAKAPRSCRMDTVLSTSFGFGGQNAVLVFQAV